MISNLIFLGTLFFLAGVFLGSVFNLYALLIIILLAALFYFFNKTSWAVFSLVMVFGVVYIQLYNFYQKDPEIIFHQKQKFQAIVTKISYNRGRQELLTDRRMKIVTLYYPSYNYGDLIEVEGTVKPQITAQADGVTYWPKINLLAKNRGYWIKAKLLAIKDYFQASFKKLLPHNQAALLAGITFGGRTDFSEELKKQMQQSGVSHIVAVSGYNISIILDYLLWLGIIPTIFIILAFVIMTGAEASVVRAAIMGLVLLLASKSKRPYDFPKAVTAAAFLMTLANPRVLVWDLGFQLSFLAVLGIVYLVPFFKRPVVRFAPKGKIKSWILERENFWITIAAQTAVAPLLIYKFQGLSLSGILANVLILPVVPWTMLMGFLTGLTVLISNYIAQPLAWLAGIFLTYELWLIEVFSKIGYVTF